MYKILDFARLRPASHIIWDIDGTITDEDGELSQEVAAKIIALARDGVYHSFITGRDAKWIIEKAILPMQAFFNFPRVQDALIFFGEVGSVVLAIGPTGETEVKVHPAVENHPLRTNEGGIRDDLKALAYNPEQLQPYEPGRPVEPPYEVIYDANKKPWLIDRGEKSPPCHPYVWSTSKTVFATLEKIRSEDGKVRAFEQTPYVQRVARTIRDAGLADVMDVEEVSTAINIVPKVDALVLGKSWAAGRAIENIWDGKFGRTLTLDEVIHGTMAVGDGRSDLGFTSPSFPQKITKTLRDKHLQMIFVGRDQDLPVRGGAEGELLNNIVIQATGQGDLAFDWTRDIIRLEAAAGARVVSALLDFLRQWGYFRSF